MNNQTSSIKLSIFGIILVLLFSCSETVDNFKYMYKLRDSLKQIYPGEDISIHISNDTFINISFVNSELKKKKKSEKEEIAQKVSQITTHFFGDQFEEGYLTFSIYKNYIIYKYSESLDHYALDFETDTL